MCLEICDHMKVQLFRIPYDRDTSDHGTPAHRTRSATAAAAAAAAGNTTVSNRPNSSRSSRNQ